MGFEPIFACSIGATYCVSWIIIIEGSHRLWFPSQMNAGEPQVVAPFSKHWLGATGCGSHIKIMNGEPQVVAPFSKYWLGGTGCGSHIKIMEGSHRLWLPSWINDGEPHIVASFSKYWLGAPYQNYEREPQVVAPFLNYWWGAPGWLES